MKPLKQPMKWPMKQFTKERIKGRITGRSPTNQSNQSTEPGLTLVECLAAIVIFSLTIVAITPPIMLAMASRVRSFHTQQAMHLAQGEIDRVRLETEEGKNNQSLSDRLPPDAGDIPPEDVEPPGSAIDCSDTNGVPDSPTQGCQVDINNDDISDFVVQTFRTNTQVFSEKNDTPVGFNMGIRVYTQGAMDNNNELGTEAASKGLSAASTNSAAPLVVIYTPIVRPDLNNSASIYCQLLGGDDCEY